MDQIDITASEIADGNWHHLRVTPTRLYFDNTLIENNTSLQFINNNTTADGDNSGHMEVLLEMVQELFSIMVLLILGYKSDAWC